MAWQVVGHHLPNDPAGRFVAEHGKRLGDLLELRNGSILAHGFRPVDTEGWRRVQSFTEEHFLPVLQGLARDAGLRSSPDQLPRTPPESVLRPGG